MVFKNSFTNSNPVPKCNLDILFGDTGLFWKLFPRNNPMLFGRQELYLGLYPVFDNFQKESKHRNLVANSRGFKSNSENSKLKLSEEMTPGNAESLDGVIHIKEFQILICFSILRWYEHGIIWVTASLVSRAKLTLSQSWNSTSFQFLSFKRCSNLNIIQPFNSLLYFG